MTNNGFQLNHSKKKRPKEDQIDAFHPLKSIYFVSFFFYDSKPKTKNIKKKFFFTKIYNKYQNNYAIKIKEKVLGPKCTRNT